MSSRLRGFIYSAPPTRETQLSEAAHRRSTGLTLVELLVVVGIVAVLSAMAVPRVQDALIRAQTADARNSLRVVAGALEAYRVDHNRYPPGRPTPGRDPFGILAVHALSALTTPIAYVGPDVFADEFGPLTPVQPVSSAQRARNDPNPPFPGPPSEPSLLFFNYRQFSAIRNNPRLNAGGYAVLSIGPDRRDSFAVFVPFPEELPGGAAAFGIKTVADAIYDPTNGAVSGGDIGRWGGALPASGFSQ